MTYEFSYGSNQTETLFYYRTIASDTPISHTDWLPIGEKSSNYTLIVKIKVKDSYGSHSDEQFMIQVSGYIFNTALDIIEDPQFIKIQKVICPLQ